MPEKLLNSSLRIYNSFCDYGNCQSTYNILHNSRYHILIVSSVSKLMHITDSQSVYVYQFLSIITISLMACTLWSFLKETILWNTNIQFLGKTRLAICSKKALWGLCSETFNNNMSPLYKAQMNWPELAIVVCHRVRLFVRCQANRNQHRQVTALYISQQED